MSFCHNCYLHLQPGNILQRPKLANATSDEEYDLPAENDLHQISYLKWNVIAIKCWSQTFRLICKGGRKGDALVGQVSFKLVHLFNSLPSNEKFTSCGLSACSLTQLQTDMRVALV